MIKIFEGITLLICLFLTIISGLRLHSLQPKQYSNQQLYNMSIQNSMTINQNQILPLVQMTPQCKLCTWNTNKTQVFMMVHHSYPQSYIANKQYTLIYGEVWAFSPKQMVKWYNINKSNVTDWELRFKQLLGLHINKTYTHFSGLWTNPEDMLRPAYAWKLSDTKGSATFIDQPSADFKQWFDKNIIYSYYEGFYPWTRLGYTYDWHYPSKTYGMSEFLIRKNANTFIQFTYTNQQFVDWLDKN